ncbi:hypothetical protein QG37_05205 [Candidozyma auris]|uniref:Uncharacterized protein n=1 Tax=Candidozyma auris TaxID=498019 RepID=A0A0L0NUX9_CANAR|nr:hypothetical protein QG37_05205 [[Candida] auris]
MRVMTRGGALVTITTIMKMALVETRTEVKRGGHAKQARMLTKGNLIIRT